MQICVTRNRDGNLQLFTSDRIIKNGGRGSWLPEFEAQKTTQMIRLDREMFPEVEWSDDKPTEIKLVNPNCPVEENVSIPGMIELNTRSDKAPYNTQMGSAVHIIADTISYISECEDSDIYHSILHMCNGDTIMCTETPNHIKKLIANARRC